MRDAKGEAGDFFRSVYNQKPQYQGLWLVSPDGRVLAASVDGNPDWTKKVLTALKSGMNVFGTIAPRRVRPTNPLPYRGIGSRPDGGVTLAVTDKVIVVQDLTQKLAPSQIAAMNLGSVSLSGAEWSVLAPPEARVGSQWAIPQAVGRQFFPLLNPTDAKFAGPGEVTDVQLAGRVVSVRDGIAYLTYGGRIAATHRGTKSEAREGQEYSSALKMVGGVG